MKNDYLWDRTGEPDPEIQQLEEVLGTLRYQPQPLELPPGIRPERQRKYFPPLAIAAAIALMILAGALWVRVHHSQTPGQREIVKEVTSRGREKKNQAMTTASPTSSISNEQIAWGPEQTTAPKQTMKNTYRRPASKRNSLASNPNRRRDVVEPLADLTAEQREEVVAAKEQVMLALRLASAKLNLAQRKTQGSPQGTPMPGTIRNQHKVG
jgi:hypothetical protein